MQVLAHRRHRPASLAQRQASMAGVDPLGQVAAAVARPGHQDRGAAAAGQRRHQGRGAVGEDH